MRDDFLCIIEWQTHCIRARVGVGEVIALPSIELPCRAGLRPSSTSASSGAKASDYLVGQALDEAERSGEDLEIVWPFQNTEESKQENQTNNGFSNGTRIANGKARSYPDSSPDWLAMEALFRHVVAVGLGLGAKPVNYLFLLSVPTQLPPGAWERVTQTFFESLCVSSFLIVERALLQLYSCAAVSGIVVEVEADSTQVSAIYDTQICHACTMQSVLGEKDCDLYLANLLLETNPDLPQQLAADGQSALHGLQLQDALLSIVSVLKDGDWIKVSASTSGANGTAGSASAVTGEEEEEGITDVAKALASGKVNKLLAKGGSADGITLDAETDTLLVPHPTSANKQALTIGPERHRYAEPLFDPSVLQRISTTLGGTRRQTANALSIPALIAAAVSRYPSIEHRPALWESVIFTGGMARIRGIAPTLVNLLQKYARESYINPQDPNEKRQAKHQKTPEYFSEYRERPDLTGFLGGCIYAKLGFLESQGGEWMTKQAYNQHGPRIATMLSNTVSR